MPHRAPPIRKFRRARSRGFTACASALLCARVLLGSQVLGEEISFRRDVMAVLSKAGCNQGVCHGNQHGKGGFKLSLRGQDPELDLVALLRDQEGRRVNLIDPEQSLLLAKPTMQVAHEGGRRFATDSPEYKTLCEWIRLGGADDVATAAPLAHIEVTPREQVLVEPQESVPLQVAAHFADGSTRDVTTLAVYDPVDRIASINHDGLVERQAFGETTLIVRYLDRQVAVPLAFVPARPILPGPIRRS